jgi:prepilin-type N-terminal cleavage/methylation domain-containing protein
VLEFIVFTLHGKGFATTFVRKSEGFMKKLMMSQKGFTLIELMIVVGIIGILVAIAAPNFSRYQSKARQSEAKIALAAIYAGEKSFYSEYSAYVGSFDAIGYSPEGQKRFYATGWAGVNTGTVQGYSGSVANPNWDRTNYPATWTTCTDADHTGALPAANATNDVQTFTSGARGQIRDGTACDYWTIDENKTLSNAVVNL